MQGLRSQGLSPCHLDMRFPDPTGYFKCSGLHSHAQIRERGREGVSLWPPCFSLLAQNAVRSGRFQLPSQSYYFPRLDCQVSTSCHRVSLFGTGAAVASGFPFSQELKVGRRAFPFIPRSLALCIFWARLPPATSLPGARKFVIFQA